MSDKMEKLCVVMPVYNEESIIKTVLAKWDDTLSSLGIDYEIRPYNDGSKDNSLAVMRDMANGRNAIHVKDKPNGGHGNTILTGYREAVADGFDWVFQVDSDDEMGPEKFVDLWTKRNDYDFLVGRRDGRVQALPRKIISFISRLCVRLFYGKSIWDVNTPYRLMRVSAFKDFYGSIPIATFAPNVILSGLAAKHGLRSCEIPVPQHDRTTGEVSIKKWKLLKAAIKSFWQTIVFALGFRVVVSIAIISIFAILVLLAHIPNFSMCTSIDLNVWALGGRIMTEGGRLYIDYFDHKGPIIFLLNALGQLLWTEYYGVLAIEWLLFILGSILIWKGLRRRLGVLTGTFFVLSMLVLKFSDCFYARSESFAIEYVIMAIGLLLLRMDFATCAVAGAGFSFTFFIKQTLICPFVGLFIFLALYLQGKQRLSCIGAFVSSALASAAIVLVWMQSCGILQEYWRDCFVFNILYQNSNQVFKNGFSVGALIRSVYHTIENVGPFFGLACAGLVAIVFLSPIRNRRLSGALFGGWVVWLAMDILFVARCARHYDYYYIPIRVACVLSVLPLVGLCEKFFLDDGTNKVRCWLLAICTLIPIIFPLFFEEVARIAFFLQTKKGTLSQTEFVLQEIAKVDKDVPLFVWGNNTELFMLSNRKSISPYYYWTPLVVDGLLSDEEIEDFVRRFTSNDVIVVEKFGDNVKYGGGIFEDGGVYGDSKVKMKLREVLSENYTEITGNEDGPHIYLPKTMAGS